MTPGQLFGCLRLLLETGLLLALGGLIAAALARTLVWRRPAPKRPASLLTLLRMLLIASLTFPALAALAPKERLLEPQARLISSSHGVRAAGEKVRSALWLAPPAPERVWAPDGRVALDPRWLTVLLSAATLGAALKIAMKTREALRLSRWVRAQPELRRIGRIVIRATSSPFSTPLSATVWGGQGHEASIVVPVELLRSPRDVRIAIRHELQHHRQGDTHWAYALELLRCLFFWNPALRLWGSALSQLQEFACDEALVGRRSVSPQAYGRCLLRAAELAVGPPAIASGIAVGMAVGSSGLLLKRRVEMLFSNRKVKGRAAEAAMFGLIATATLGIVASAAYGARSAIQDRSMTLTELQARVGQGEPGAEIPLAINEQVLRELNRYVGTEDGREEIRKAFSRMPQYQSMIEKKLKEHGLPKDLVIVPLIESGYTNYFNPHRVRGAGLWGFIPSTARRYEMRVDELGVPGRVDDRLNEERETVAAARYFRDLHMLFQDWRLALKGYNEGERRVADLIMQYGTRDAWDLERQSESKERYLAKITAALLIYKNPGLLE